MNLKLPHEILPVDLKDIECQMKMVSSLWQAPKVD